MRFIQKRNSPVEFETWKNDFVQSKGKNPTYNDLKGEDYHNEKMNLLNEQYSLCCYCGKSIKDYNSHIEHFRPRSTYPQLQLEHGNLLISCDGIKGSGENCGHKKDNWFSDYYTISPLSEECESFFSYTIDGQIKPKNNDTRANETINKLYLNSDLLQRARRSAIYVSGLFDPDFNDIKKMELIEFFKTPINGELQNFCTAILYCLAST